MDPMVMKVKSFLPSAIVETPAVASSTCRQVARRGSPGPAKSTSVTRVIPEVVRYLDPHSGRAGRLFLPVGSLGAARERGRRLEIQAVLGVRRLDLEGVRATRMLVPGRGHNLDVLVVLDARWRVVIVTSPGSSSPEWSSTPRLRELWRGTSQRGSRAAAWVRGWVALILWSCSALLLIGLVGAIAGIF